MHSLKAQIPVTRFSFRQKCDSQNVPVTFVGEAMPLYYQRSGEEFQGILQLLTQDLYIKKENEERNNSYW